MIAIEFQPSGWSKGSCLNVGAMWLWYEKDFWSFDEGYRVEEFVEFKSEDQFAPLADRLAKRAAEEVLRYRSMFASVRDVAAVLSARQPSCGSWPCFHAGVACGLVGQAGLAKVFLSRVTAGKHAPDWEQALAELAARYVAMLDDITAFRECMTGVVKRTRVLLKLDDTREIRFGDDAIHGSRSV
jgi:hypothetical protein